jgi:hypothetical protein
LATFATAVGGSGGRTGVCRVARRVNDDCSAACAGKSSGRLRFGGIAREARRRGGERRLVPVTGRGGKPGCDVLRERTGRCASGGGHATMRARFAIAIAIAICDRETANLLLRTATAAATATTAIGITEAASGAEMDRQVGSTAWACVAPGCPVP